MMELTRFPVLILILSNLLSNCAAESSITNERRKKTHGIFYLNEQVKALQQEMDGENVVVCVVVCLFLN